MRRLKKKFFPATRAAIDDDDLRNEAEVEHPSAKDLIMQLPAMSASDDLFDAKVIMLGDYIAHHLQEEKGGMFAKAKKAKLDLADLGAQMITRKADFMEASGAVPNAGSMAAMLKPSTNAKSAHS